MAVGIHTEENEGVRLHVDRGVLRDIIEARIASDKRRSYYTIGSVFSAMGFTLVALGSKNYTASSLFVLIGIFYYLCISGVSVNYVDDEWAGEDGEDESVEIKEMGRTEKVELVRVLMQELGGFHLSTEDIEHLVQPVYTVKGEEGQEEEDSLEGVDTLEPVLEVEGEDGLDGDAGEVLPEPPRLARAETSYSEGVVVDEGVVVEQTLAQAQAQAPIEEAVEPVVEVQEAKNNVEDESGSATPEASGSAD